MDPLTSSIVNFKQASTISQIQIAVAKKVMDSQKMNGAAAVKLLDAACKTNSSAGDQLVAAATGVGSELDTYA